MKSVLDSSFAYTPSSQTDVRKTLERIRGKQPQCQCISCGNMFTGHKRRVTCMACRAKDALAAGKEPRSARVA